MKTLRALVIDDDPMLGQLFTVALSRKGFIVEYLDDSTKAMATIEATQPDLVTLDVNMPHVSGIQVLHAIRANPATAHIRVMMVTANRVVTMDEEAYQEADLVMLKPVDLAQFLTFAQRISEQTGD